ncbi:MAG: hypothetical protein JRI36_05980 [Deltaproteobacteria bacterium]|nr:hypothetical protein [Deltaproteobacteria bacterium]
MNNLNRSFSSPTTHAVLFLFFLLLMSWPLLTIAGQGESPRTVPVFLFALWGAMIAVLFSMARHCRKDMQNQTDSAQEPEAN